MDPLTQQIMRDWAEEVLKPALRNEEKLLQGAINFKVAIDKGKTVTWSVGFLIGAFVLDLIDPNIAKREDGLYDICEACNGVGLTKRMSDEEKKEKP